MISWEARDIPRHGSGDPLLNRSGLMSWDDGLWHKDGRESPGKAEHSQEVDQERPKTPGEA